jgi:hypothetical protein
LDKIAVLPQRLNLIIGGNNMAGSIFGTTAKLDTNKKKNTTVGTTTAQNYVPPPIAVNTGIQQQIDYTKDIPNGYTPAQELAMRNRIRATDTAQNSSGMNRIAELMAARGLSGSGAEVSALGSMIRGQNATRQGALSNLDISNAQLTNQNAFQKAGMLNQLTGMGENARQFDQGQSANMYQFGTQFDESKRQYDQGRNDYNKQLDDWLKRNGLTGGTGSYAGFGA